MAYMPNNGVMSAPGPRGPGPAAGAPAAGRVTGVLLIAAAVLLFAMAWLPVTSVRFYNQSWEIYVWKGRAGPTVPDYVAAVPYVLIVLVAGVTGILLAMGTGARRRVLFWVAAFAGGMVLAISSGDVTAYAQGFKETISPASGFWVITLAMLVAIAALVSALRDAATSKRGVGQENNAAAGGAADRVAGVFLIAAAAVDLAATFEPVDSGHSNLRSIWRMSSDGSAPLPMAHLVLILIIVVVVAIALLAGAGVRNPSVRAAGAAVAALVFTSEFNGLFVIFAMMGPKFWEYMGIGLVLLVLALLLSFGATVAGLVAQSARPRPVNRPRPSFAAMNAAPHPFASAPNPFAPVPAANPFAPAPPAPAVEATVKIEPAVTPPRMARVYDGKNADGRPVADRPAVEGNTRMAVLAYLESAPIVLAARSFEQDEFVPGDRDVPLNFRSDGVWVWAGAVPHYLHKHGLAPEPELVQHIANRGYRVGEIGEAAQRAAIQVITGS